MSRRRGRDEMIIAGAEFPSETQQRLIVFIHNADSAGPLSAKVSDRGNNAGFLKEFRRSS
jgi:hypothetical protein